MIFCHLALLIVLTTDSPAGSPRFYLPKRFWLNRPLVSPSLSPCSRLHRFLQPWPPTYVSRNGGIMQGVLCTCLRRPYVPAIKYSRASSVAFMRLRASDHYQVDGLMFRKYRYSRFGSKRVYRKQGGSRSTPWCFSVITKLPSYVDHKSLDPSPFLPS